MRILCSERFLRAYRKGSLVIQHAAEHAIHDFVRGYRADRQNFVRRYDRVAGIRMQVLEVDISGKDRLLVHFANRQLTLLDMGPKHIVPRYTKQKLDQDLAECKKAPDHFWPERPSGFFAEYPDTAIQPYGMELYPEWVYWLDEEQSAVQQAIQSDLLGMIALLLDRGGRIFFVVGGPGTGKSCILLNLLKYYFEEGFHVGLVMADQLADYVAQSTHATIEEHLIGGYWAAHDHDVVLVDDPPDVMTIGQYARLAQQDNVKVVVLAFDPLQLDTSMTDQEYHELIEAYQAQVYALTTCYRQKKNVGQATKKAADVIAASTPFLDQGKIENYRVERTDLTHLANELQFRNPRGYTRVFENATVQDVYDEMRRINKPRLLWQHWYSLLVVEPHSGSLRSECYQAMNRVKAKIITLDEIRSIKGLEFQHVFLFLKRDLYEQVEYGFKGSGQRVYNQRRLLRIPFSRAKDSLVTFVLDND